jgi:D-amino peptidase
MTTKVFISADIEGVTGTSHWDETDKKASDYREFAEQMTAEVNAACEGALEAGATEVWVKDAHGGARNIISSKLPRRVKLVRGWSGHPFGMVEGVDESFGALALVGYHSRAGSAGNPLAHTYTGSVFHISINEHPVSEFLLSAYAAESVHVPAPFLSGDLGICQEATSHVARMVTVPVKEGKGSSVISIHPELALARIKEGVQKALEVDLSTCHIRLPDHFTVEIQYKSHAQAFRSSFYPGASLKGPHTITFESDTFFDVLTLLSFVV